MDFTFGQACYEGERGLNVGVSVKRPLHFAVKRAFSLHEVPKLRNVRNQPCTSLIFSAMISRSLRSVWMRRSMSATSELPALDFELRKVRFVS